MFRPRIAAVILISAMPSGTVEPAANAISAAGTNLLTTVPSVLTMDVCRANPSFFDIQAISMPPVFGRDMEEAFNDGEEVVTVPGCRRCRRARACGASPDLRSSINAASAPSPK